MIFKRKTTKKNPKKVKLIMEKTYPKAEEVIYEADYRNPKKVKLMMGKTYPKVIGVIYEIACGICGVLWLLNQ